MFMVILTLTWAPATTVNWGGTMKGGTELPGNPYGEVVYVQKKPSTTVCFGTVHDETTVFTSGLCEVGDESIEAYQVVEIPTDLESGAKTHEIETVTRGLKWPLTAKVITLKSPGFKLCPKCHVQMASWYKWYRDFNKRAQEHSKTIVYGFGPPLKAAVMEFKTKEADDCVKDYDRVREESWPEIPPRYLFCIYDGRSQVQVRAIGDIIVYVFPGITCDDSVGSLVKINQEKVIGIVLKAFCGNDKLAALGIAGYSLMKYKPDKKWVPGTGRATTTPPHIGGEWPPKGGGLSHSGGRSPPTKDPRTATGTTDAQQMFSHPTEKPRKEFRPNTSVNKKASPHGFKTPPTIQRISTATSNSPGIWCSGILFVLSTGQ